MEFLKSPHCHPHFTTEPLYMYSYKISFEYIFSFVLVSFFTFLTYQGRSEIANEILIKNNLYQIDVVPTDSLPISKVPLLKRIRAIVQNKQYDKAIEIAKSNIQRLDQLQGNDNELLANLNFLLATAYWGSYNYDRAEAYLEQALQICDDESKACSLLRLEASYLRAKLIANQGDYEEALDTLFAIESYYTMTFGVNSEKTGDLFYEIGYILDDNADFLQAIQYYEKALDCYAKNLKRIASIYNNIGLSYRKLGYYNRALAYFEKAIRLKEQEDDYESSTITNAYSNIGAIYYAKYQHKDGITYFQKAIEICESRSIVDKYDLSGYYNNVGVGYKHIADYDKAIFFLDKALYLTIEELGKDHIYTALTLNNLAEIYVLKGEYKKGIDEAERARKIFESTLGPESEALFLPYMVMATGIYEQGRIKEANQIFHKIENLLRYDSNNPFFFERVSDFTYLEHYLYTKVKLNSNLTGQPNNNQELIFLYTCLKKLGEYMEKKFADSPVRSFYTDQFKNYYEELFALVLEQNDVEFDRETIFTEIDQLKEKTLYNQLSKDYEQITFFGLPDSLLEKEQALNLEITNYEKKKYQEEYESQSPNDSLINTYGDQIFTLTRERDKLRDLFRIDYEDYYNFRYSQQFISVSSVQDSLLDEDQALLEYFVGDSVIFTFLITKDTFDIAQFPKTFPLKQHVQDLRESIYKPYHTEDITDAQRDSLDQAYRESAYMLYEKLIKPVEEMIPEGGELIIVPDGVLGYIPFDALLTEPVETGTKVRDYPYLLKKYQTSIAYSATLLKEMQDKQHKRPAAKSFLGVAPRFDGVNDSVQLASRFIDYSNERNRLYALEENIPEVTTLRSLIGGDLLTDTSATKSAFLKRASDYRILHLSTHGKANDQAGDYSFLAFYRTPTDSMVDDWLYNRELYNMQLNADMVVLSACETGIGELQRGEGIISLARGFSYAGAKSIITSLWTVNDKEAPVLMESFYKYLKDGYSKDAALRQAKLDYLKSSTRPAPYYWATFIPIGDMQPIELREGVPFWGWGLIIAGLLAVFLYWRSKKMT